ncbi:MAG: 4-hydroxy-3-methylbut-2-enyl diphosphate reductase [Acidobacteriota bacterium]
MSESATYFQRGFGLKQEAGERLLEHYASGLVDHIRAKGGRLSVGPLTFRVAKEMGFCYGVERAVEYAYETRVKFPDRRVFLTSELIHNPHVNGRMREQGIAFLETYDQVTQDDVVIIPAFGVTLTEMAFLRKRGCIMVDTTCGSVMNVWKNVDRYARDGFTTVIHGKHSHQETLATCSRATKHPDSHYLVVRDMEETEEVARFIEAPYSPSAFLDRFRQAVSIGFKPARHLERIGLANQTTMLMSESLAIGERLRRAFVARHGEEETRGRFRTFDTICSATQERQDAVAELLAERIDVMIVVGGFNSRNTTHLAEMCEGRVAAFHIEDEMGILDARRIRHRTPRTGEVVETDGWLPAGDAIVGITAGASTPNNKIGFVVERILRLAGLATPAVAEPAPATIP